MVKRESCSSKDLSWLPEHPNYSKLPAILALGDLGLSVSVYISVSLAYIYTNMQINKKKSLNILVSDFYNVGGLTEVLILLNTAHLTRDVLHDDKSVLFVLLLHPKNGFSVHLRKVG